MRVYDESAGNMTATDLSSGSAALFGFGGLAIGAVLSSMLRKRKNQRQKPAGYTATDTDKFHYPKVNKYERREKTRS